MATIIERDVHHSPDAGSDSSAATATIVTIVALIAIVGFALFFFRLLPLNGAATTPNNGGSINIDAELPTPTPTPDSTTF